MPDTKKKMIYAVLRDVLYFMPCETARHFADIRGTLDKGGNREDLLKFTKPEEIKNIRAVCPNMKPVMTRKQKIIL